MHHVTTRITYLLLLTLPSQRTKLVNAHYNPFFCVSVGWKPGENGHFTWMGGLKSAELVRSWRFVSHFESWPSKQAWPGTQTIYVPLGDKAPGSLGVLSQDKALSLGVLFCQGELLESFISCDFLNVITGYLDAVMKQPRKAQTTV